MTVTGERLLHAPAPARLAPPRRVRRPRLAAASVLLMALSGALFVALYQRAGHQEPVLAVATAVDQGQTVTAGDLKVVRLSQSGGLQTVPPSEVASVVGLRAVRALVPGSLLDPADLTSAAGLAPGMAEVGVALKPGQLPGGGVTPGAGVEVLQTPPPALSQAAGTPVAATVLTGRVQVLSVQAAPAGSGSDVVVVSLAVPAVLAPAVVGASSAGTAALAVVPGGP